MREGIVETSRQTKQSGIVAAAMGSIAPVMTTIYKNSSSPLEHESFIQDLSHLFTNICANKRTTCILDMTKHLYSNARLPNNQPTGAECAKLLLSGVIDNSYTIPRDEMQFINRNLDKLGNFFKSVRSNTDKLRSETPLTFVSLGCGPHTSVEFKDLPLVRALGATKYIAMDINGRYAQSATEIVRDSIYGIETESIVGDFTDPFDLTKATKDSITVLSILGDTIGQYPFVDVKKSKDSFNGVPFKVLLNNLGKATNFNSILLATIDADTNRRSLTVKYQGEGMMSLMETFWHTVKEVVGDPAFNPRAFRYHAAFDESISAVQFIHTAEESTSIRIKGQKFDIEEGTRIIIGCSQKTTPSDIIKNSRSTDYKNIPFMSSLDHNSSVRMIGLVGKNHQNRRSLILGHHNN